MDRRACRAQGAYERLVLLPIACMLLAEDARYLRPRDLKGLESIAAGILVGRGVLVDVDPVGPVVQSPLGPAVWVHHGQLPTVVESHYLSILRGGLAYGVAVLCP